MNDKLDFLKELRQTLFETKSENWNQEHSVINTVVEEIEWQNLSSIQKNERRIGAFSLSKKWSNDPFIGNKRTSDGHYDYALIEVYELLRGILEKYYSESENSFSSRLEAVLIIERRFYDEKIIPLLHVPLDMFKKVLEDIKDGNLKEDFLNFLSAYEKLWDLWPKNPYKPKKISR